MGPLLCTSASSLTTHSPLSPSPTAAPSMIIPTSVSFLFSLTSTAARLIIVGYKSDGVNIRYPLSCLHQSTDSEHLVTSSCSNLIFSLLPSCSSLHFGHCSLLSVLGAPRAHSKLWDFTNSILVLWKDHSSSFYSCFILDGPDLH